VINDRSVVNILYREVMAQKGISLLKTNPVKTPLIGIEGSGVLVKSILKIPVIIGAPLSVSL
jgi:hypothetical protein